MKISWTVLKLESRRDFVLETATYKVQRDITQKVYIQELWFLCSAHRLCWLLFVWSFMKVPWTVFELQRGHGHITKSTIFNFKGPLLQKYTIQSYGSCTLHIVSCCFTFVLSFMKISQTVLELQSGHDFVTDRRTDRQTTRAKTICLPTLWNKSPWKCETSISTHEKKKKKKKKD